MATADFSRIATNIGALNALQSLNSINAKLGVHQQRLATGKRINSAADDPAGLTIATKLNARAEGLKVAGDNIADAQNLLSVAESGLGRINDILVQMRNKAEQAASDTLGQEERAAIVEQMQAYSAQIDDIVEQTKWNGTTLIDGSFADGVDSLRFQTGADEGDATTLTGLENMEVGAGGLGIAEQAGASATEVADLNGIVSAVTYAAGLLEPDVESMLGSGTYSLKVTTTGAYDSASALIELLDSSGNAVAFDPDTTADGDDLVTSMTADLNAGGTINFGNGLQFTVGAVADDFVYEAEATVTAADDADYTLKVNGGDLTSASSAADFATYMSDIDTAMDTVSGQLSKVGALSGRLTFKAEQVATAQVNVESSYNRIMNADMAYEQLEATKFSILQQTSTTMLAQANTAPQNILSLFR